ncbi:hypothetical protein TNIN_320401 [Trichonephila inaurata madagascariensis]|uniref:Uncharacterized protein n=1 Tax=Trichonephila inaurata madagascariensis TaxID=2747483 RepID=A0A8X7BSI3_9ARAC|nr:hypothetical protein TNIN_320401 [Trichonephila inaurata madagascariensis]
MIFKWCPGTEKEAVGKSSWQTKGDDEKTFGSGSLTVKQDQGGSPKSKSLKYLKGKGSFELSYKSNFIWEIDIYPLYNNRKET